jgi:hypothetical protein
MGRMAADDYETVMSSDDEHCEGGGGADEGERGRTKFELNTAEVIVSIYKKTGKNTYDWPKRRKTRRLGLFPSLLLPFKLWTCLTCRDRGCRNGCGSYSRPSSKKHVQLAQTMCLASFGPVSLIIAAVQVGLP